MYPDEFLVRDFGWSAPFGDGTVVIKSTQIAPAFYD
jgi:hypothetical protein